MERNKFWWSFLAQGWLAAIFASLLVFLSCSNGFSENSPKSQNASRQSLKIVNWNLQTFFDGTFDGNEYAEYKSSKSGWSKEKYETRLKRLASVIKTLDADIVVMEELEKAEQLQDISNQLSGTFDFSKIYSHAFFATDEGASIGCAVLSRFPIGEISVHSMDIRGNAKQPSMRPIIQFSVYVKDKTLTMFVNHWKSKFGGAETSEIWRDRQENILSNLMAKASKKNQAVLATGDFNRDISEFTKKLTQNNNLILRGNTDLAVYSPWILENQEYALPGSYWYKNAWERIDHFFVAGDIELSNFCAENGGEWADSEGHPFRYQIWNGQGYSDHLPISCVVRF